MKKFKCLLVLVLSIMFITPVGARDFDTNKFAFEADDRVNLTTDVNGSVLIAGNIVKSNQKTAGIGFVFGNDVVTEGELEYGVIAGNSIDISAKITRDAFIFGNNINVKENAKFNRDAFIYGNKVTLSGEITRDIEIHASTVILNNVTIKGNVKILAGNIEIKGSTKVDGKLTYNDDAAINIDSSAVIGSTEKIEVETHKVTFINKILAKMISYGSLLFIFVALVLLMPKAFNKLAKQSEKANLSSPFILAGKGSVLLLMVPFLMIVLFMTVIGLPLGFILLPLYIIAIYLSTLFSGYLLGLVIWKKLMKKEENHLLIGLIGIIILGLLSFVPVVNTITTIITLLMGLGIIFELCFTKTEA